MLALATSPVRRLLKADRQPGDFQRFLLTGRARKYPCRGVASGRRRPPEAAARGGKALKFWDGQ